MEEFHIDSIPFTAHKFTFLHTSDFATARHERSDSEETLTESPLSLCLWQWGWEYVFVPSFWSPERRAQAGSIPATQPAAIPVSMLAEGSCSRCAPFLGMGSGSCWHLHPPCVGEDPGHARGAPALPVSRVPYLWHPVLPAVAVHRCTSCSCFLGAPLSLSILWKCVRCTCTTSTKADEAKVNWIKLLVVVVQGRQECQFPACVHVLLGRCKSRSYHFWLIALLVSCRKHNPVFHLTVRMEIARVREKNTIILMFSLGGKSNCVNALIYAEFCV